MEKASQNRPLILTLRLDPGSQQFFDAQRTQFFPPSINFLAAHVTLFHHLPRLELEKIYTDLEGVRSSQGRFPVLITGVRSLGAGVAYTLSSEVLLGLRSRLHLMWADWLTPQDRQKFNPHITVQNKVSPDQARDTLSTLRNTFEEKTAEAIGLDLWTYEGGPWSPLQAFLFSR